MAVLTTLYDDGVTLLRELAGPHGIFASSSRTANYRAVFTRDAVMAGVAGLMIDDRAIIAGLARTLVQLRELQGAEGQIASNVTFEDDGQRRVSFGTLAPRIDATTWYLLGVALAARANVIDAAAFRDSVRAVVRLLDALEYNGRHLIYVPVGGNWADEYVYDGYVLYDQVLRAWALRLVAAMYDEPRWMAKAHDIERTIEERYWPAADVNRRYPIAAISPTMTRDVFDLAACSLLAVSGVGPRIGSATLDWIVERFLEHDHLPPAFHPVIEEGDAEWPALRRYHLHDFRNRPHEYHNGGIWPVWLGWLALGLARAGRGSDVERLRAVIERWLGAPSEFDFHEYLHGLTGAPGGVTGMAYSATGLVLLRTAGSPEQVRVLGS
jgi:hypothetical protein